MNTTSTSSAAPLALVTGASRGLGFACAEYLSRAGYHVVAVARTQGALEELDDRIQAAGGTATLAPMDITDAGAMQHLCQNLFERWQALPLWVHTAVNTPPLSPVTMADEKDFAKAWATNVTALQRLIPYVTPLLQAAGGGQAVFFEDPRPLKFASAYKATKAAQRALIEAWQAEATTATATKVHLLTPEPMPTALRARFHPGEPRDDLTEPAAEAARLLQSIGL